MVPIGKRAFMKGKLSHTNEILASLGDGYFVKYSASQAIALCNRRIAWADEMLKSLEAERNLYEMKQYLPLGHDVFGEKDKKDIMEHWTENRLDEWRVQHRQREKEYRQKLKSREKDRTDIRTEEDLFKRLDELEIEEELEDEMYRLEAKQKEFYGDDFEDGEAYDESDVDTSDSDQVTTEIIQEEFKKLKDMQMNRITSSISSISTDTAQDKIKDKILDGNAVKNEESHLYTNFTQDILSKSCSLKLREDSSKESKVIKEKRRISFAEPCVVESNVEEISISEEACSVLKRDDADKDQDKDEDTIKIEFSHSLHNPNIPETNNMEIKSPVDIYKMFGTPKSILKRSPNDMIYDGVALPLHDITTDSSTEDEDEYTKQSAYSFVLKDEVQENKELPVSKTSIKKDEKKIVSRFKLERAGKKK
ncbi:hypothetical protein PUN28_002336 [Cardiocondyla obscurior]